MLFSRAIPFLAAFLSLGTFAIAKPVIAIERREDSASVKNVLVTLKSKIDEILPEIQIIAFGGSVSGDSIETLVDGVVSALDMATGSLATLDPILSRGISDETAGLVEEIVKTLEILTTNSSATVDASVLTSRVDVALGAVLSSTVFDVAGSVTPLLTGLISTLRLLGMTKTLIALNV